MGNNFFLEKIKMNDSKENFSLLHLLTTRNLQETHEELRIIKWAVSHTYTVKFYFIVSFGFPGETCWGSKLPWETKFAFRCIVQYIRLGQIVLTIWIEKSSVCHFPTKVVKKTIFFCTNGLQFAWICEYLQASQF